MTRKHLFVTCTNSQNLVVDDILAGVLDGTEEVYLVTNETYHPVNLPESHIFQLDKIRTKKDYLNQILTRSNRRKITSYFRDLPKTDETVLYVSHFSNIITSHVVLNRDRLIGPGKIAIRLIPDGMLSFWPSRRTTPFNRDHLQRWATAVLTGMTFRPFRGIQSDPFGLAETIYSYLPNLTNNERNLPILPIPLEQRSVKGRHFVILGHFNMQALSPEKNVEVSQAMADWISANRKKGDRIYFKMHPRLADIGLDVLYRELVKRIPDMEVLESKHPLEQMIEEYSLRAILAVASTAMVTVKLKYGKTVRCVSFGTDAYMGENYPYYERVFREAGVELE